MHILNITDFFYNLMPHTHSEVLSVPVSMPVGHQAVVSNCVLDWPWEPFSDKNPYLELHGSLGTAFVSGGLAET